MTPRALGACCAEVQPPRVPCRPQCARRAAGRAAPARASLVSCSASGGNGNEESATASQQQQQLHGRLSVYAVSDLHTDYAVNMHWVQSLRMRHADGDADAGSCSAATGSSAGASHFSALIIAGDVSDDLRVLRKTLTALARQFDLVAFVPGNHCLWVKGPDREQRNGGAADSLSKLAAVNALAAELGVLTAPALLGGLALLPLLAWHHQSWDREPDIPGIPRAGAMTIADYAACVWPPGMPGGSRLGSEDVAAAFDALNEQQPGWAALQRVLQQARGAGGDGAAAGSGLDTITFSHFLPHQDLLPEKRLLSFPNLAKAVGSDWLSRRLQQLQPDLHVFGHSHFAWDLSVNGVRCLQAPLAYPSERQHRLKSLIIGVDTAAEAAKQQQQPAWHHGPPLRRQQPHGGGGDGSSSHRPSPLHVGLAEQQARDACSWLPVRIYEAVFTAELAKVCETAGGTNGAGGVQQRLVHGGVPVLHPAALLLQQQEQASLQAPLARAGTSSSSSSSSSDGRRSDDGASRRAYVIRSWSGAWCPNLRAMWSDYYATHARDPANTQLAPWVAARYSRARRRLQTQQLQAAAAAAQEAAD